VEGDGCKPAEAEVGDCGGTTGEFGMVDVGDCVVVEADWLLLGSSDPVEADDGDRA
jgi:hypothetical protein